MNILVTGALRGLGACITKRLLAQGHCVHAFLQPELGYGELVELKENENLSIYFVDLANPADIEAAMEKVTAAAPVLHAIFNVAGVLLQKQNYITANSYQDIETTFRVNTFAPMYITNLALPVLEDAPTTLIMNVCSETRHLEDVGAKYPTYCISKTATTQYCFSMQDTFRKLGQSIRVLAVHPGRMATAMGGINSQIIPDTSAEGLLKIWENVTQLPEDLIYLDYMGNPMLDPK